MSDQRWQFQKAKHLQKGDTILSVGYVILVEKFPEDDLIKVRIRRDHEPDRALVLWHDQAVQVLI